jgi:elongation factor Ts
LTRMTERKNVKIPTDNIKALREKSGAGVIDCRNALIEANGDMDKAINLLKERALYAAQKTSAAQRVTLQGLVECYIHTAGRIGSMVELNCETDFVARTFEFKELAHNIAMQVAAVPPVCVTKEEIPKECELGPSEAALLCQPFIRDPSRTVQDIMNDVIAKTGEKIQIRRFARFELGQ